MMKVAASKKHNLELFFCFLISIWMLRCASSPAAIPEPPPTQPTTTTIALGSCAHQERSQSFWTQIAAHSPELFLFMGDNVYGDVRDHGKIAMPELGLAYARLASHKEFQEFRKQIPILPTWDDHDYACNDCGAEFPLRADAEAHFERFWGVPSDDPRALRPGIYFSQNHQSHGKQIQIIMLDTRSFRTRLKPTPEREKKRGFERYMPSDDAQQDMLGPEQWRWLESELKRKVDLRIVVSSIQIISDDHGFECWRNLPQQRMKLLSLLAESSKRVPLVIASGDRHMGSMYKKEFEGAKLYELTSSSLNIPSKLRPDGFSPPQTSPHFPQPNYGIIQIHWPSQTLYMLLYGITGELLHRQDLKLREIGEAGPP